MIMTFSIFDSFLNLTFMAKENYTVMERQRNDCSFN